MRKETSGISKKKAWTSQMHFAQIEPETVWWMANAFIKEPAIPHLKGQVEMFFYNIKQTILATSWAGVNWNRPFK